MFYQKIAQEKKAFAVAFGLWRTFIMRMPTFGSLREGLRFQVVEEMLMARKLAIALACLMLAKIVWGRSLRAVESQSSLAGGNSWDL
jgi:hypothetical protein